MNAAEIQQGALNLLPAVLADVDDGSMEAMRRLEELKRDPSVGRTWDQIKSGLGR